MCDSLQGISLVAVRIKRGESGPQETSAGRQSSHSLQAGRVGTCRWVWSGAGDTHRWRAGRDEAWMLPWVQPGQLRVT